MILVFCDPRLAALFTPAAPELGRYEVCTRADALEASVEASRAGGLHVGDIEALESLDAFGTAGSYDRSRLARLYGGTRVHVAHGWQESADRFESVTLLSPYPDATLTRLNPGTMEVRWIYRRDPTVIAMSPFTTSIDITGSPLPIVVSPKRGPN